MPDRPIYDTYGIEMISHLVPLDSWHGVAEDLEHDEEVLLLAAGELVRRLGHEPRIGLGLLIGARLEGRRGPVKTLKAEKEERVFTFAPAEIVDGNARDMTE